ncbi:MAG: alanine--tRNA ligase [Planctomycetota bacterium]
MSKRTAAQIRRDFIEFFEEQHQHTAVPSSSVVPHDDPTLLFTNAGMNQFKDVFLGQGERPFHRAVDTQKCIRAGGKHNDLEDVGKDSYHHTFFEMLGNWSFGNYFKDEAIEWAWSLLTHVWKLDAERLYVTVFEGDANDGVEADEEAEELWRRYVPAERISRWGRKDNFWEMGDTGPCGPCSEIHYDGRSDEERAARDGSELVNRDHPDVIEIWNLVFIQYNRAAGTAGAPGPLTPLPAKHVDTGMGLERVVRILQGASSNYDTDLWTPIFQAIQARTGARPYAGGIDDPIDIAYRVIADHIRCLTVALADGGRPGPEKAGYVLRRILRRAVRHARQTLGVTGPVLHELVTTVAESLGEPFPEIPRQAETIAAIIRDEEEQFLKTLDRGLQLFDEAVGRASAGVLGGEDVFRLHDTFGFPIDLTRVMAEERGLSVDEAGYESAMETARETSRRGGKEDVAFTIPPEALAKLRYEGVEETEDIDKYHGRPMTARIMAIWNGTDLDEKTLNVEREQPFGVITDRTNFYAEQGGQVGDTGMIRDVDEDRSRFKVIDTQRIGEFVVHIGRLEAGKITVGEPIQLTIDRSRRNAIKANHTATHLLNHALRGELSEEQVDQRGSLVADDRLRFDFTCSQPIDGPTLGRVEQAVSDQIEAGIPVSAGVLPLEAGRRISGLRAVFGEKYPDPVRVVSVGPSIQELGADPERRAWEKAPIEFCGGTHLDNTSDAGAFVITGQQGLAAGIRRITAMTGPPAMAARIAAATLEKQLDEASGLDGAALEQRADDLVSQFEELTIGAADRGRLTPKIESLRARVHALRKQARKAARGNVVDLARDVADGAGGAVIVESFEGADRDALLSAMDVIRAKHPDSATMLFSPDHDASRVTIVAAVPDPLIKSGLKAGDWIKQAAAVCGGSGGGRPDKAQAGGKDPSKVDDAVATARQFAEEKLG